MDRRIVLKFMGKNEYFEKKDSNLNKNDENTAKIGLFWFSQDYSKIIKIEGIQEIRNKK